MPLDRVLLCALLTAALVNGEEKGVALTARLDWGEQTQETKRARWHPVHVELTSHLAEDLQGTVRVEVEGVDTRVSEVRYERTVQLPKASRKRFDIDVRLEGMETALYVISDLGSHHGICAVPISWIDETTVTVLVVSPRPGAFTRFARDATGPNLEQYNPAIHICPITSSDVPQSWRGLDGVETLIWDATSLNDLTTEQSQAIRDWVGMGGNLVLAAGDDAQSFYEGPLGQVVPGKYVGREEVDPAGELARLCEGDAPKMPQTLLAASIEAAEGVRWKATKGMPLLIERRVGLGRVCVVPFDLSCDAAVAAKRMDLLVEHLLDFRGLSVFQSIPAQEWSYARYYGQGGTYRRKGSWRPVYDSSDSLSETIARSFNSSFGLSVPPAKAIAIFLALYVGACLLNLFAWRTAHRRELSWATLLCLSLGFAGFAYRDARLNAQATRTIQCVTLQEVGLDGATGRTTSWYGMFTPVWQTTDMSATEAQEGFSLAGWDGRSNVGESTQAITEGAGPFGIKKLAMLPRSVTCARIESPIRSGPPIRAKGRLLALDSVDIQIERPASGTALPPLLVLGAQTARMAKDSTQGPFHYAGGLKPMASSAELFATLWKDVTSQGVDANLLYPLRSVLSQDAETWKGGYVVMPVLDAPRSLRLAGRSVEADHGLTILVAPVQWESVADSSDNIGELWRKGTTEIDSNGTELARFSPLCDGLPTPPTLSTGPLVWNYEMRKWQRPNAPKGPVNPFDGSVLFETPPASR